MSRSLVHTDPDQGPQGRYHDVWQLPPTQKKNNKLAAQLTISRQIWARWKNLS